MKKRILALVLCVSLGMTDFNVGASEWNTENEQTEAIVGAEDATEEPDVTEETGIPEQEQEEEQIQSAEEISDTEYTGMDATEEVTEEALTEQEATENPMMSDIVIEATENPVASDDEIADTGAGQIWSGKKNTDWYSDMKQEYRLATPEQLAGLAALVAQGISFSGKKIYLECDIYLNNITGFSQWNHKKPGNKWMPIGSDENTFQGEIDGQNHTIYGMYITSTEPQAGLFGNTSGGSIRNLNLKNLYILQTEETDYAAGICASCDLTYIENCTAEGVIAGKGMYAGGIVGENNGNISECNSYVTFDNTSENTYLIGGIAAVNRRTSFMTPWTGMITKSCNRAAVSGGMITGGLAGKNDGKIIECVNYGTIQTNGQGDCYAVEGQGSITNCKNYGKCYLTLNESNTRIEIKKQTYTYTGKAVKPEIYVYRNSKKLESKNNYKIHYENNTKIGEATVKVTGIGKYQGTISRKFSIVLPVVEKLKLESGKNGSVLLSWKKCPGADGYKIHCYDKNRKEVHLINVADGNQCAAVDEKLKKGDYEYYITAYGKVKGKTYESKKSDVKTIHVKKGYQKQYYDDKLIQVELTPYAVDEVKVYVDTQFGYGSRDGAVIEQYSEKKDKWIQIADVRADAYTNKIEYIVKKLSYNHTYRFRARAYLLTDGKKVYSKYSPAEKIKTTIAQMNDLHAYYISDLSGVRVCWKKQHKVDGYELQYKRNIEDEVHSKQLEATQKSYLVTDIDDSKTASFKIRAYKKIGKRKVYGAWSTRNAFLEPVKNVKISKIDETKLCVSWQGIYPLDSRNLMDGKYAVYVNEKKVCTTTEQRVVIDKLKPAQTYYIAIAFETTLVICRGFLNYSFIPMISITQAIPVTTKPSKPQITSVHTNKKNKSVEVFWKKQKNVDGYRLRYSLSSDMKKAKTIKSKTNTVKLTDKKIRKKAYLQIRAYKLDASGKRKYSSWSKVKTVNMK